MIKWKVSCSMVNAYEFIHDRISGKVEMPSLAEMIKNQAVQITSI